MSKAIAKGATAILLAILATVVVTHADSRAMYPQYAIELEVTPTEGQERAYDSVVTVRNTKTHAVIAKPTLHSIEGKSASLDSSVREPALDLRVTVEIGAAGRMASYVVELRDHDGVSSTYKAQVRLEKP